MRTSPNGLRCLQRSDRGILAAVLLLPEFCALLTQMLPMTARFVEHGSLKELNITGYARHTLYTRGALSDNPDSGEPQEEFVPAAPIPENELERLRDLRRYRVLDTPPDAGLDALTLLASRIAETPIALISLTDENRQWFKSRVGLDVVEIPRDWAPCAHAVATGEDIICEDMQADVRFSDNPLVQRPPHLRFYAGMALVTPRGTVLGTLAVIDTVPRSLSPFQRQALASVARQIVEHLELHTAYRELAAQRVREQEFEARLMREKSEEAQRLAAELHDGIGQQLTGISMLISAATRDADEVSSMLAEINTLLAEAIAACRSTALQHGGFLVRTEGLDGALNQLVQSLEHPGGPRFVLDRAKVPVNCLDHVTGYHLFRIASEAIANALHHSGAKTIRVRTFHADGRAGFEVEDDGVGRAAGDGSTDGIGKAVMAYRAQAIGALLEASDLPRGGLRFRCRLPCGCNRGAIGD